MAYVISDDCIACGTCIDECPVEAISEGDKYSINPDLCTECGTCADACPCRCFFDLLQRTACPADRSDRYVGCAGHRHGGDKQGDKRNAEKSGDRLFTPDCCRKDLRRAYILDTHKPRTNKQTHHADNTRTHRRVERTERNIYKNPVGNAFRQRIYCRQRTGDIYRTLPHAKRLYGYFDPL